MKKTLEIDSSHAGARLGLGKALEEMGRPIEALKLYRESLLNYPNEAELHKAFMNLLDFSKNLAEAFAYYGLERVDHKPIEFEVEDILCCAAVRNEISRLPFFLRYYREKQVDRFLIVDNASSDETLDYLCSQPDVYLWRSDLSFNRSNFGSAWFELLLREYGRGHWCLIVDADEILYYEDCETKSLQNLCRKLDEKEKRAFDAVLLEMYSSQSIQETKISAGQDPREVCCYFDRKFYHVKYPEAGPYKNQTCFFGGARQRTFGESSSFCLNKVALLRYDLDCVLAGGQHWTNLPLSSVAEESGCLLHFKYYSDFHTRVMEQVARKEHYAEALQYRQYLEKLKEEKGLSLYDPRYSVRLQNSQQLIDLGVMRGKIADRPKIPKLKRFGPPVKKLSGGLRRPFWSVMITVYDRVQWLERALKSVLEQAEDVDHMEIKVILDGSDREVSRTVRKILARIGGGRIGYSQNRRNLGHPHVFNACIDRAFGRWVHILHDDDYLIPGFYHSFEHAISLAPEIGAAFCRHLEMDREGRRRWTSWIERETPGIIDGWLERIGVSCRLAFSSIVVKRDVYETLGGFSPEVGSAFDWEMWKRIAVYYPVWFESKALVRCCKQGDSLTETFIPSGQQITDSLEAIEFSKAYLPSELREPISRRAREHYARYALDLARSQLGDKDYPAAVRNIKQGLRASGSAAIRLQLFRLFSEDQP